MGAAALNILEPFHLWEEYFFFSLKGGFAEGTATEASLTASHLHTKRLPTDEHGGWSRGLATKSGGVRGVALRN